MPVPRWRVDIANIKYDTTREDFTNELTQPSRNDGYLPIDHKAFIDQLTPLADQSVLHTKLYFRSRNQKHCRIYYLYNEDSRRDRAKIEAGVRGALENLYARTPPPDICITVKLHPFSSGPRPPGAKTAALSVAATLVATAIAAVVGPNFGLLRSWFRGTQTTYEVARNDRILDHVTLGDLNDAVLSLHPRRGGLADVIDTSAYTCNWILVSEDLPWNIENGHCNLSGSLLADVIKQAAPRAETSLIVVPCLDGRTPCTGTPSQASARITILSGPAAALPQDQGKAAPEILATRPTSTSANQGSSIAPRPAASANDPATAANVLADSFAADLRLKAGSINDAAAIKLQIDSAAAYPTGNKIDTCAFTGDVIDASGREVIIRQHFAKTIGGNEASSEASVQKRACELLAYDLVQRLIDLQ